jgi:branched-chain amino acid transport system ATP-binding protein
MTGVLDPTEGHITLEGQDITRLAPHQRVRRGLVRTFQINQLFNAMTPLETLAMVVSQHRGAGARWWQALGQDRAVAERCDQLLEQFHLTDVMHQRTEHLAYGKRRLLEIGIALACEPRVLLLDEPVAGVPAGEREELLHTVAALPEDVSVLLIEHDMDLVFDFATAHHGAGERRGADRGHAGGDRRRSPGQGGVSRARGGGEPCLICCRLST